MTVDLVGEATDKDIDAACPQRDHVQSLADKAADIVGSPRYYSSEAVYGTKVHVELKHLVEEEDRPDLKAEVSTTEKKQEATYGEPGSVRVDVLERVGNGTACVYDLKTGQRGLTPARMGALAVAANRYWPGTARLLVIEMRPSVRP